MQGAQHTADLAREKEQRQQAEAALQRSEAEYKSVVEVLSEGIAVIQADGTISSVNASAAHMVNSSRDLLIGRKLLELRWHAIRQDGTELPHTEHPAIVTLRDGIPLNGVILGLHTPEQTVRWLSVNTYPLRHEPGAAPYAVVASFTEVTERLQREREMQEAYNTLDKITSEFIGVVSHELRTPVTALRGALGFLESGLFASLPPKGQELIAIARTNTDRLTRIINNIIDLERLKSGRITLEPVATDIPVLVDRIVQAQQAAAEKKRILVNTSVAVSVPILADTMRLTQVLENLITNAIKFSPPDSEVNVRVHMDADEMILFEVIDTGIGVAPTMLERLFKSFSQENSSNTRLPGGAGLGLAIARSIVEQMGGRIGVESEQHVRTRFWFTIPAVPVIAG